MARVALMSQGFDVLVTRRDLDHEREPEKVGHHYRVSMQSLKTDGLTRGPR